MPAIDSTAWYGLNSSQSGYISPGNMPEDAVQAVHAAMRALPGPAVAR
jgi:hypothetical protein